MMRCLMLLLTIFILLGVQVVSSAHFRISISPEGWKYVQKRSTKYTCETACDDYKDKDAKDLRLPEGFSDLKKPWADAQLGVKIYTSVKVDTGMQDMFKLKVPGLGNDTIQDIFDILIQKGCLAFPYGGCVRDQFLGKDPGDLDMESNCNASKLVDICREVWVTGKKLPATVCTIYGAKIMHIGDDKLEGTTESIDAAGWNDTFYGNGTLLEYTTNSIAYFSNPTTGDIVIDLTGTGVTDTCGKKVGLPVGQDKQEAWFGNDYYKIYRAWKLRAKEYEFKDEETKNFIAKEGLEKSPSKFQYFYCSTVLKGRLKRGVSTIGSDCESVKASKATYDGLLKTDFGDESWESLVKDYYKECNQDDVGFFQAIWNYY